MTHLTMIHLQPIDFIDPGADDSEPAKGVTNGYLRLWHDALTESDQRIAAAISEAVKQMGLEQKLIRIHRALDDALGDSDVTHIENDDELRRQYPTQWAAEQLAKIIDDLWDGE